MEQNKIDNQRNDDEDVIVSARKVECIIWAMMLIFLIGCLLSFVFGIMVGQRIN